jgi:hypothetical protein
LTDGVDLRGVTTARDANADIDTSEFVKTNDEEGFVDLESRLEGSIGVLAINVYLEAEDFRLDEVKRFSVDFDEAFSSLDRLSV